MITTKTEDGWDHSALLDMEYMGRIIGACILLGLICAAWWQA
jgi:hypothetical protein